MLVIGYRSDAVALLLLETTEKKRGKDKEMRKGAMGSGLLTNCLKGWERKREWSAAVRRGLCSCVLRVWCSNIWQGN